MNWYTLSCHESQGDENIGPCFASIIPLDCLQNEKIRVSEKLCYELRDFLGKQWILQPTYIRISEKPLKNPDLSGLEVILHASKMHKNDDVLVVQFESEDYESEFRGLNMLVASRENRSFKREEISDIDEWTDMKNFSLYCFLADINANLSVIL